MPQTVPCKACGAPMIWVRTAKGKMMPLDAEPTPDGTWGIGEDGVAYHQEPSDLFAGMLRKSHYATCPAASLFRRKGNGL
jgi:hypothetical protein